MPVLPLVVHEDMMSTSDIFPFSNRVAVDNSMQRLSLLTQPSETLSQKGPVASDSIGRIFREGVTDALREQFPKLDYVTSCEIVDETVQSDK